jgi:FAD-linked sulfhydryl oxidase
MPAPDSDDSAKPIQMPPHIWGPIFWSTLHIASLAYSDNPTERQKKNMKAFYESLIDVLPCPICRKHYEANLEEMPLDNALESRMGIINWVFTMHNRINVQLGKREYTFEEFLDSMRNLEKAKKACPPSHQNTNAPKPSFHELGLTAVDGLLLGTGSVLVMGVAMYYLYTEVIRKNVK